MSTKPQRREQPSTEQPEAPVSDQRPLRLPSGEEWQLSVGQDVRTLPTNLDLSTFRGRALLSAAASPGDLDLTNGEVRFRATHYVVMLDQAPDRNTGEIRTFPRVAFITATGEIFRTTAAHGPSKIKSFTELFTVEEWARGIPLVVRERKSKDPNKGSYHDINPDFSMEL
jgi:hypothetical protein